MKEIKKLFINLPMFNFILTVVLYGLLKLEIYFFNRSENPAPILIVAIFLIVLLMGGFVVCGFVFGIFNTIKYDNDWKKIAIQIVIWTIIIEFIYIIFFFSFRDKYISIIGTASIVVLEQISGYVVGCIIGKLINHLKNKQNISKT